MVLRRTTTKDERERDEGYGGGAAVANEAVLFWRAFEPAYECGPDAQTHNELSPQHHREHA
jgi:hypothetical protein